METIEHLLGAPPFPHQKVWPSPSSLKRTFLVNGITFGILKDLQQHGFKSCQEPEFYAFPFMAIRVIMRIISRKQQYLAKNLVFCAHFGDIPV